MKDNTTDLKKMEFQLLRDTSKELTDREKNLSDKALKLVTVIIILTGFVEAVLFSYLKGHYLLWDVLIIMNALLLGTLLCMYAFGFVNQPKVLYKAIQINNFSDIFRKMKQDIEIKSERLYQFERIISVSIVWLYGSIFFEFVLIGNQILSKTSV
jgi:hypothetical protein